MKKIVFFLAIGSSLLTRAQDNCESASPVTLGTFSVPAVNGTNPPSVDCLYNFNDASLAEWYVFTPTENQNLLVSTYIPGNPTIDTRMSFYSGDCGNLVCVGGDDDSGPGYTSIASLNAIAGTTYYIVFDDFWSAAGFEFNISVADQDDCGQALLISAGLHTVEEIDGTEIPFPICAPNGTGAEGGEWYKYIPNSDYTVTITTDIVGSPVVDTRFHVYNGTCGALSCVAGDDDSGNGLTSTATFQVNTGLTYYIAFDDRWTASGFDFLLTEDEPAESPVSFTATPINITGITECVVDMNNDELDDIVSVEQDMLRINYQQEGGGFVTWDYEHPPVAETPYWSICAGDLDANGFTDLLYAGGGATFMMANADGTAYTEVSPGQWIFCQRSNMVDINNDGILDAFVCHDVEPNVFYIHDGNSGFTYNQGGLGDTADGGNYGSVWIDYDNDCDIDMYIAKCRGGDSPANINQMHRNNGDGTFTEVGEEIGLADNIQTWSSAWADYDNDGDMDVVVGASSNFNGSTKLMLNNGDGTFTDGTAGSGWDMFTSNSIEWAPADFNNDGFVDVLGAGNKIYLNNGDMTFTSANVPIGSGAMGDLNNDGFMDIVGSQLYLNNGNENNYVKIHLKGNDSNADGIGARIRVVSALGNQIRDVRSGEGFSKMSTLTAHFGLGLDTEIERIEICWPSGMTDVIENPAINTTHVVVEGTFHVGITEANSAENPFDIYPVPASAVLYIGSSVDMNNGLATIIDMEGRQVAQQNVQGNQLNIESLASGVYMLQIACRGEVYRQKFIKE
jgi:hypothetical protein